MKPIAPFCTATLLLTMLATTSQAMGLLIPDQADTSPLAIESHRVRIDVTDSAAVTHVDQVFRNDSGRSSQESFLVFEEKLSNMLCNPVIANYG